MGTPLQKAWFLTNLTVTSRKKETGLLTILGLQDFVGYGQPLWLPHTGQAQGQPVHLVSTP